MRWSRLGLFAALLCFLGLAAWQLHLPGVHYDEAFEAVPAMQLLLGQPVTTFRDNGLWLSGQHFPLMTQDYIGALNTYLALPFFVTLGITPISLRIMSLVIGVITLWLAYQLTGELYGPEAAGLATLLLAVNPSFVFWSRQGVFVTSVTATLGLAAAWAWLQWWRKRTWYHAALAGWLCGLGLYAKLLFLWLILALGMAWLVVMLLRRGQSKQHFGPRDWSHLAVAALAFVVGCIPLLAYNIQTGGTLSSLSSNLTTSYYGTNNLAVLPNLVERLGQLVTLLLGSQFWYLGATYANWLQLVLFAVAAAVALATMLVRHQERTVASRALIPLIVITTVVLASCATVSALWVTHFALIVPWPAIAIAGGAHTLWGRWHSPTSPRPTANDHQQIGSTSRAQRPLLLVGTTLCCLAAGWIGDVVSDVRYHQALAVSGGLGAHSDAVDDLAEWLTTANQMRPGRPILAMDWGISAPVALLTRGQVTPIEAFGYSWRTDTDFSARLAPFLNNPDSLYLWRAPDEIIFDRSRDFRALYEPFGLEEDIVEAFYERSGRPVLGVTRLVTRGLARNPPSVP